MFIYNNTDILNPDDSKLRPMNGYGMKPYGPRTGLRVLSGLGAVELTPGRQALYDLLVTIPGEGGPAEIYAYVQDLNETQALGTLALRLGRNIYASPELDRPWPDGIPPTYAVADYLNSILPQLQVEAKEAAARNVAYYQREAEYQESLRRITQGETEPAAVQQFQLAQPGGPMFFSVPTNLVDRTPNEKAQFYLARSIEGFTDSQIRQTIETVFGVQSDANWSALGSLVQSMRPFVPYMGAGNIVTPDIAAETAARAAAQIATTGVDELQQLLTQRKANGGGVVDDGFNMTIETDADAAAAAAAEVAAKAAAAAAAAKAASDAATRAGAETAARLQSEAAAAAAAAEAARKAAADAAATAANEYAKMTLQQKVARYQSMRASGMTDEQIRAEVESKIGPQSDADWSALRAMAAQAQPAAAPGIAPLLLAVAAAYILGA